MSDAAPASALPPFPIVVGSPRSGTTLLRAMFDAHPEMAVPPESHFIPTLAERRAEYETGGGFDTGAFLAALVEDPSFGTWRLPAGYMEEELPAAAPSSFPDAVRDVFRLYARHHGKARWADKTPTYAKHLPLLAELLPEARFIHVIRDGRDVVVAMGAAEWMGTPLGRAAWWQAHVRGREEGLELGPDRYVEVRYETLVAEPEPTLRALCEFVELPFDPAMTRYFERTDALVSPESRTALGPLQTARRDWRRDLPRDERRVVELMAGDTLEALGYPTSRSEEATGEPASGSHCDLDLLLDATRRELAYFEGRMQGLMRSEGVAGRRARRERSARTKAERERDKALRRLDAAERRLTRAQAHAPSLPGRVTQRALARLRRGRGGTEPTGGG